MKRKAKIIIVDKKCKHEIGLYCHRPYIAFEPLIQVSRIGPTAFGFVIMDEVSADSLLEFAIETKKGFVDARNNDEKENKKEEKTEN